MRVAHILTREAWAQAQRRGEYRPESLDREGFIHFSLPTQGQLLAVANHLYRDQADLLVLIVEVDRLTAPLRFEPFEPGGQAFPHLYGPLNLNAVVDALPFPCLPDGTFELPPTLR